MDILDETLLQPQLAQKRLRVAAAIIDFFINTAVTAIISLPFGIETFFTQNGTDFNAGYSLSTLPALLSILIWFLQFPLMEGVTGQTIGKKLIRIKVVKDDYTPTTVGTSFVRHFFDGIDCIFLIGLIIASLNKKNQRIGDLVARTLVVKSD